MRLLHQLNLVRLTLYLLICNTQAKRFFPRLMQLLVDLLVVQVLLLLGLLVLLEIFSYYFD